MSADESKAISSNILSRILNDANMRKFNLDLQNIDVNPVLNETKTNQSYMLLADRYHQVFDKSFPLIQINNNSKSSWFDKDLHKLLQTKKIFKKYCAKKNFLSKVNYNKARNVYFRTLKEKKKAHYSSVFERHKYDLKQTWKIVNNLLGKKKLDPCSTLKINYQLTCDAATIANHFNLHFAEVGTKLVNKLPPTSHNFDEYLPLPTSNSLYFNPTSLLEIKRIITDLKSKNSSGMDGIPSKALKCTPDNILFAITLIFNLSLSNGEFMMLLK